MNRIIMALGMALILAPPAFADDASLANLQACLNSGGCSGAGQDATSGYAPNVQVPAGTVSREVKLVSVPTMCSTTYSDNYTSCGYNFYHHDFTTFCTDPTGVTKSYPGNVPCP